MHHKRFVICISALLILLLGIGWLFWPGIDGPFLLDDYTNLNGLSQVQEFGWPNGVLQYLAMNNSGALGRPVSLLSFLIDGQTWPTEPLPFKRTNILIHLANTILVFLLTLQIARRVLRDSISRAYIAGFIAAALWAVHPLQVSTVLYVVQRMTMLSTLFGLAAIICMVRGRERVEAPVQSLPWLCGFIVLVMLSTLSKENGALVFPIAWVVDTLLFSEPRASLPRWYRNWRRLFLVAPSVLLFAYLLAQWPSAALAHETRDFSVVERLLTQPRVLALYLYNIFVPSSVAATLYYDSFEVSRGLISPPSTIVALIGLLAACLFLWKTAGKWPLIGLAGGWFLIGHSMEASFIPLELVFEHRNYLPMVGLTATLAIFMVRGLALCQQGWQKLCWSLAFLYVTLMTVPWTYQAVHNWSDEARLIYTWAFYDEKSIRTQSDFAQLVAIQGQPDKAIEILEALVRNYPDELTVRVRLASFYCEYTGAVPSTVWLGFEPMKHRLFSPGAISAAQRYVRSAAQRQCPEINTKSTLRLFDTLLVNDRDRLRVQARAILHYILGNYLVGQDDVEAGFYHLDQASLLQPTVDIPLRQADLMYNMGRLDAAERYLSIAETRNNKRPSGYPSREKELKDMFQQLQAASEHKDADSSL